MKKILLFLTIGMLLACHDPYIQPVPEPDTNEILSFAFLTEDNVQLTEDCIADIYDSTITIEVPFGTDTTTLVARFITTAKKTVSANNTVQESGTTINNFTGPVTYTVTAEDGSTLNYTIQLSIKSASVIDLIGYWEGITPEVQITGRHGLPCFVYSKITIEFKNNQSFEASFEEYYRTPAEQKSQSAGSQNMAGIFTETDNIIQFDVQSPEMVPDFSQKYSLATYNELTLSQEIPHFQIVYNYACVRKEKPVP